MLAGIGAFLFCVMSSAPAVPTDGCMLHRYCDPLPCCYQAHIPNIRGDRLLRPHSIRAIYNAAAYRLKNIKFFRFHGGAPSGVVEQAGIEPAEHSVIRG